MSLFDGLYSYEVVLLILAGSLLLTRLLPALLFDVKATGPLTYLFVALFLAAWRTHACVPRPHSWGRPLGARHKSEK